MRDQLVFSTTGIRDGKFDGGAMASTPSKFNDGAYEPAMSWTNIAVWPPSDHPQTT